MTDRVACKTPGCPRAILPSTAEQTGGYCMPCANAAAKVKRDEFIAAHRKDVDRFQGIEDPVEILLLLHRPPKHDPLLNYTPYARSIGEVYRSLPQDDLAKLLLTASKEKDLFKDVSCYIAHFSDASLLPVQAEMVRSGIFYPGYLFRNAPEDVTKALLDAVMTDVGLLQRNHLLIALAWTKHPLVLDAFDAWRKKPPSWANTLHVPVHTYALEAGYAVGDDGVIDLYDRNCRPMKITSSDSPPSQESEITLCSPLVGPSCPACGGRPFMLADFSSPQYLGMAASRFVCCPNCINYGPVFAHSLFESLGWASVKSAGHNEPHAAEEWFVPQAKGSLGPLRSPWAALDWCIGENLSQVGGHPSWINDASYPECPICSRLMPFMFQVAIEDVVRPAEGIIYAFECKRCSVIATSYDQS